MTRRRFLWSQYCFVFFPSCGLGALREVVVSQLARFEDCDFVFGLPSLVELPCSYHPPNTLANTPVSQSPFALGARLGVLLM